MYEYDDSWMKTCYACVKPIRSVVHVYPDSDKTDPWFFAEPVFRAQGVDLDLEPYENRLRQCWASKEQQLQSVLGDYAKNVQCLQKDLSVKLGAWEESLPLVQDVVKTIRGSLKHPLTDVLSALDCSLREYRPFPSHSWESQLTGNIEDGLKKHIRHVRAVLCLDNYVKFNVHASCFPSFNPAPDQVRYGEQVQEESFRKVTERMVTGFSHVETFLEYVDHLVGCGRIPKEEEQLFRGISAGPVAVDFKLENPVHYESCKQCRQVVDKAR